MVERGGLENRCARKRTKGSNPLLSAKQKPECDSVRVFLFSKAVKNFVFVRLEKIKKLGEQSEQGFCFELPS